MRKILIDLITLQCSLSTSADILMLVFRPNLTTFTKLVGKVAEEELAVRIRLWERFFKCLPQLLKTRLFIHLEYLTLQQTEILPVVLQICFCVQLPPTLNVTRNDLVWLQRIDQIQNGLPRSQNCRGFNLVTPCNDVSVKPNIVKQRMN
jgi:hypothetical protein